jgi:hypothetical protein
MITLAVLSGRVPQEGWLVLDSGPALSLVSPVGVGS